MDRLAQILKNWDALMSIRTPCCFLTVVETDKEMSSEVEMVIVELMMELVVDKEAEKDVKLLNFPPRARSGFS